MPAACHQVKSEAAAPDEAELEVIHSLEIKTYLTKNDKTVSVWLY